MHLQKLHEATRVLWSMAELPPVHPHKPFKV